MSHIKTIHARQIFDSRGYPTIEVDVITDSGIIGRASIPSGASTGEYEAVELRDGGKDYSGKGVLKAVKNVNGVLAQHLIGHSIFDQYALDQSMINLDGTSNKSNLGANALLGISLAVAQAASSKIKLPLYRYLGGINACTLPLPMMNIINGGVHSDAPIAFQEFMIIPIKFNFFFQALQAGVEIFHKLKEILQNRGFSTAIGDEGGFAPNFNGTSEALDIILEAIQEAGYHPKKQVMLAIDCAASEFYKNRIYDYTMFEGSQGKKLSSQEQVDYLVDLCNKYPIQSIEDPMDQNDWEGWKILTEKLGKKIQLVGDDLFVTNTSFLEKGIQQGVANSILIKVNQIGTLTETIEAIKKAQRAGYTAIISHRSGETEDHIIADLAVACNTGQIKTGSASRSDRMGKYNQLLRIEEKLAATAYFPQWMAFNGGKNR